MKWQHRGGDRWPIYDNLSKHHLYTINLYPELKAADLYVDHVFVGAFLDVAEAKQFAEQIEAEASWKSTGSGAT